MRTAGVHAAFWALLGGSNSLQTGLGHGCVHLGGARGVSHAPAIPVGPPKGGRLCYQKSNWMRDNRDTPLPPQMLWFFFFFFFYRKPKFHIHLELELTELSNGKGSKKKRKIFGIFSHETHGPTPLVSLLSRARGRGEKLVPICGASGCRRRPETNPT